MCIRMVGEWLKQRGVGGEGGRDGGGDGIGGDGIGGEGGGGRGSGGCCTKLAFGGRFL